MPSRKLLMVGAWVFISSLRRTSLRTFGFTGFTIITSVPSSLPKYQTFLSVSSSGSDAENLTQNIASISFNKDTGTAGKDHTSNWVRRSPQPAFVVASESLAIDPTHVVEVAGRPNDLDSRDHRQSTFVEMFRGSADYIANHRNTLAVYHIPGGLLELPDADVFRDLMNDIAITWLLGMKLVLVVGCRHQMETRLGDINRGQALRVTDKETLRIVEEEAGFVRFEVERQLARSLRVQRSGAGGGDQSGCSGYYDGNVVSGNFYSAQPFGILDGIDYEYTGFLRRVEVEKIRQQHNNRDICLLTTLGVSPSGEVFNVNSECLAAGVAGALGASKIIYFTERDMELRHKARHQRIQSLRVSDASALLDFYGVKCDKRGFTTLDERATDRCSRSMLEMLFRIGWGTRALTLGVKRAHIISPRAGAVLQELYTRDGNGILVAADIYEGMRRASVQEVAEIYELVKPLVEVGKLILRPKATIENEIDTYYVYTRDSLIVACGQLKLFEGGFAEIGCLVVSKDYRSSGRGDAMLGYLERLALTNDCSTIFVLSTQTMEWFLERGFSAATVEELPKSRQETYNHRRASKIYLKTIETTRDLDASELFRNR